MQHGSRLASAFCTRSLEEYHGVSLDEKFEWVSEGVRKWSADGQW